MKQIALFALLLAAPASASDLFVGSPNTLIAQASPPGGALTTISACGGVIAGLAGEGDELYAAATSGTVYRYREEAQQVAVWATLPGQTLVGVALRGHEVLVATTSSRVIALDRSRGTELRHWDTPFPITSLFSDRGVVLAGTNFGAVMRLEDDGTIGFLGSCGSTILAMAASETEIFLGSAGNIVWRVDRATGFVTSSFPVVGEPTGLAFLQGQLFVGTPSGVLYTYALNGSVIDSRNWGSAISAVTLGAPGAGTAYCFGDSSICPCNASDWQGPFGGCASSVGVGARLVTYGSASVSGDDLELAVLDTPPTTMGRFYMGGAPAQIPFGNGLLCAGSGGYGQFRFPAQPAQSSGFFGFGAFRFGPGIAQYSQQHFGPLGVIQPGSTWRFQAWFRDVQNPCGGGFNTSNASSVTFQP